MIHLRATALLVVIAATACGGPATTTPLGSFASASTPSPTAAGTATPSPSGGTPTQTPTQSPTQAPTQAPTQTPGGGGGTAPTPTPVPTPIPPGINANPASLEFDAPGTPAQNIVASEAGYTGTFTENDTCTGIATIAPPASQHGPSATYVVTPTGAGTCVVTYVDATHATATAGVSVNAASLSVPSTKRETAR